MWNKYNRFGVWVPLLAPAGDNGGGGSKKNRKRDDDDDDDDLEKPPPRSAAATAAKFGDNVSALATHINTLEDDNFKLRRDKRKMREQLDALDSDPLPEGAVVLTKEQAADWEAYQKLGKPKDLETLSTKVTDLEKKQQEAQRKEKLNEVASGPEAGVKFDVAVLADLDSRIPGLDYEKKKVKAEDGTDVEQWFVKYQEGEGEAKVAKEAGVVEFFKQKFPKYMGVLLSDSTHQDDGIEYPSQLPAGAGGGGVDKNSEVVGNGFMNNRYAHNRPKKEQ